MVNLINFLDISEDVSMPGFVENPYDYMTKASVLVLSSVREGLPTVIVEAISMGTSIVATDCKSGPGEVLKNGQYGRLVPINDEQAMAEAIIETIKNPIQPEYLKMRAMDFTIEAKTDEYIRLI
ncbi:glycosyl transferase, partial [Desulfobacteraceae bacterium SEEP-SAG9]